MANIDVEQGEAEAVPLPKLNVICKRSPKVRTCGPCASPEALGTQQRRRVLVRRTEAKMMHMSLVLLGAVLILIGVLFMVGQPLWHGRLSGGRQFPTGTPKDTLEPRQPDGGFGIKSNGPGLVLFAAGAVLLVAAAVT